MTIPQLLHSMCAELPDGDLNAIRKARGFSASETASRTSFASFYVTAVGLEKIMQAITPEEAVGLGLLHETGEVDVSFFERIYGTGNQRGTYTQRYKYTFDNVKKNLVRRGLVVMAEVKMRGDNAQMERWRFALPPEFAPYLPPIASKSNVQPGQFNDKTIRKKLLELIGGEPAIPKEVLPLAIKRGSLYIKEDLFSIASFEIWQKTAWQSTTNTYKPNVPASLSPIDAALKLLNTESWIDPKSIESALNIYCFGVIIPSAEKLLHKGWELGFLSRLEINGAANYRIAPQQNLTSDRQPYPSNLEWADTTSAAGCVKIDLRVVPLTDLEKLNILTELTIENGVLIARPSLVKLGRAIPEQRNSLLSIWLAEQVPAFGKVLETVNANWGKTILHENLLFARVRDLSLRIQLERELKEKIIVLSNTFANYVLSKG